MYKISFGYFLFHFVLIKLNSMVISAFQNNLIVSDDFQIVLLTNIKACYMTNDSNE